MDCPWNSLGQNTGVGRPFPSPGNLPNPGIKARSSALQVDSLPAEPQVANILMGYLCKEGSRVNVVCLGTIMLSATSRSADF